MAPCVASNPVLLGRGYPDCQSPLIGESATESTMLGVQPDTNTGLGTRALGGVAYVLCSWPSSHCVNDARAASE